MGRGPGGTREEIVNKAFGNLDVVIEIHQDEHRLSGPPKFWQMIASLFDVPGGTFDGTLLQQYDVNLLRDEVVAKAKEDTGKWLREEQLKLMMLIQQIGG
jgi:hypothetical protein